MIEIAIDDATRTSANLLEVGLPSTNPDFRMFIFTGMCGAGGQGIQDGMTTLLKAGTAALNLSGLHNRKFDPALTTATVAFCGLTNIQFNWDGSPDFLWAIEDARALVDLDGTLLLILNLASQGRRFDPAFNLGDPYGFDDLTRAVPLERVGYQVNVITEAPTR